MPHKPLILKGQSRTGAGSVVNGAGTGGALVRVGPARLRIWPPRSVIGLVMGLLSAGPLQAGGSAETTLVVVNTHSTESRQVANHYVALRDIPPTHVVWLDQVPTSPRIDIQAFRERIWKPVRAHLKTHGLEDHIDVIAYSAGFPYAVDFSRDLRGESIPKADRRLIGKFGSLTGLTFFAHRVEAGDLGYLGLNLYFRRNLSAETRAPRPTNEEEEALFQRAQKLVKRKQYEEAVAELEKLTDAYRWSAPAWYDLAVSQAALERDGEAMRSLEKAVEAGWRHSLTARSERRFKRLRESPRFQALIERMQQQHTVFQPAHGFRGHYVWHGGFRPQRHGPRDSLNRYFLSVMLGYTGFQGNSVHEVLDYLTRAAESDGSHPDGTVYLLENRNIRAQARERYFHATLRALKERGRRVEIISRRDGQDGIVPRNRHDVMGAVVGTAKFDWNRANSQFLPGAIAESLTSYGGHFERRKQTKLSEFLRHGAAGSSGAVAEPFSIQAKFPVSYMHVHYADGSSLAEAFYQSIERPYQLIVVGDPLARPFATFSRVSLESPATDQPWKGAVLLKPRVELPEGQNVQRLELWVDGRFIEAIAPWDVFLWDTRTVDDGFHELRIVAVDDDRIETRSYRKVAVDVANAGHRVTAHVSRSRVAYEDNIIVEGTAARATEVSVFHGEHQLGSAQVDGGQWRVSLPARAVGPGTVELFAHARFPDQRGCRSIPVVVDIATPVAVQAAQRAGQQGPDAD